MYTTVAIQWSVLFTVCVYTIPAIDCLRIQSNYYYLFYDFSFFRLTNTVQ